MDVLEAKKDIEFLYLSYKNYKVVKNEKCIDCGGEINSSTNSCLYCKKQYDYSEEKIKYLFNELIKNKETLKKLSLGDINSLLLLMPMIKDLGIYSTQNHVMLSKIFLLIRDDITNKLKDNSLNDLDTKSLFCYIKSNFDDDNMELIYNNILKNYILNSKPQLSEEIIKLIINKFIEVWSKKLNIKKDVVFDGLFNDDNKKERANGMVIKKEDKSFIKINVDLVNGILKEEPSKIARFYHLSVLIHTIYHEITHVIQDDVIKSGILTKEILQMIHDNIISKELDGYYYENYERLIGEASANKNALKLTHNYLKNVLNLNFSPKMLYDTHDKEIYQSSDTRTFEEKYVDTSEIILRALKEDPALLEKYPQLKAEYEIIDGEVLPIDTEIIANQYHINENFISFFKRYIKMHPNVAIRKLDDLQESKEIAKKLGAESLYSHYLRCIINNKTIDFILKNRNIAFHKPII